MIYVEINVLGEIKLTKEERNKPKVVVLCVHNNPSELYKYLGGICLFDISKLPVIRYYLSTVFLGIKFILIIFNRDKFEHIKHCLVIAYLLS